MKYYKLPTGKITTSLDEYLDAWDAIRNILEERYGVATIGFDPGFSIRDKDDWNKTTELPMWLVERMVK